jgi:hypothetical protein
LFVCGSFGGAEGCFVAEHEIKDDSEFVSGSDDGLGWADASLHAAVISTEGRVRTQK